VNHFDDLDKDYDGVNYLVSGWNMRKS